MTLSVGSRPFGAPCIGPVLWCLTAATAAAQTAPLPPAATQWAGNRHNSDLFYASSSGPNEARTQLLYPLADLPATLSTVRQISFRPIGTLANAAASIDLDITMSTSPRDPDDPSSVFATNAPGPVTTVYSGTVALPATTLSAAPHSWAVPIALQTPFTLSPAASDRSLVLDVRCHNSTGRTSWWAEQYTTVSTAPGQGSQILSQPACLLPNGQPQMQSSFQPNELHPGGSLRLTLGVYPNNQPSAAANALVFGLRAGGGSVGSTMLPVPLASVGVPSPPNCQWAVEPLLALPMAYSSFTWGANLSTSQMLRIPDLQSLSGVRFFAQNAALLQYPSGLQVFPSVAMEFTIGDSHTPSGGVVSAPGDRNATSGAVSADGPVSILLQ